MKEEQAKEPVKETDKDPRHHIIPDEGFEWKHPLTNKELFDENARLRQEIKELKEEYSRLEYKCEYGIWPKPGM